MRRRQFFEVQLAEREIRLGLRFSFLICHKDIEKCISGDAANRFFRKQSKGKPFTICRVNSAGIRIIMLSLFFHLHQSLLSDVFLCERFRNDSRMLVGILEFHFIFLGIEYETRNCGLFTNDIFPKV